jgi:hypothetical protein
MKAILVSPNGMQRVTSVQGGRSGTLATLHLMALHSMDAAERFEFRALVGSILAAAGITPGASVAQIGAAVQQWTRQRIRFVRDPDGTELLLHPAYLLTTNEGDCDDQSALVAALLMAMGLRVRFKAVARTWPEVFEHVYCQVFDGAASKWIALETTLAYSVGREVPNQLSEVLLEVGPELQLSGLFSSIKKAVSNAIKQPINFIKNPVKSIKETLNFIPAAASGFASGGPWGAVAAVAVAKVQQASAQLAAKKYDAASRAAFEAEAASTAKQLADAAGQPSRADEFAARIKSAADPQKAVEAIIAEFQAQAIAPTAAATAKAAESSSNAPARDWVPVALGVAGLAVSVYAVASTSSGNKNRRGA